MNTNKGFFRLMAESPLLIMIGQSGCGKGTVVAKTIQKYSRKKGVPAIMKIEMGDEFRNETPNFSPYMGGRMKKIQEAGAFQSYVSAVTLWCKKMLYTYTGEPIILDGSPRSAGEAEAIVNFFGKALKKKIIVLEFILSDHECDKRMDARNQWLKKQGLPERQDTNTPEKRAKKLEGYYTGVKPGLKVFQKYQKKGGVDLILLQFSTAGSKAETMSLVMESLNNIGNTLRA